MSRELFQGMRYIYEVYKEMSFSKAAKNLYISQPSLSNAVKKTEQQIGAPIFDRSTNPIGLTELGKEYIRSAELIMDVEKGFEDFVNDRNELKSGTVSIGGTNLFASFILPPLISRYTERYPAVHVDLVEAVTSELIEKLSGGALDLLIETASLDSSVYEKRFFCEEHLLLTVPKNFASNEKVRNYAFTAAEIRADAHLSSRIPPVPLETFSAEPFLLLREGNDTRSRADQLFHNCGFTPHLRLEPEQQVTAYNLSCYGMGISLTGDMLVKHVPESSDVLYYKLNSRDSVREVNVYFRRSRYMPKAVSEFLKFLQ